MSNSTLLSNEELYEKCFKRYTPEEMQESLRVSEEQFRNGQYRVYNKDFWNEIREKFAL